MIGIDHVLYVRKIEDIVFSCVLVFDGVKRIIVIVAVAQIESAFRSLFVEIRQITLQVIVLIVVFSSCLYSDFIVFIVELQNFRIVLFDLSIVLWLRESVPNFKYVIVVLMAESEV